MQTKQVDYMNRRTARSTFQNLNNIETDNTDSQYEQYMTDFYEEIGEQQAEEEVEGQEVNFIMNMTYKTEDGEILKFLIDTGTNKTI
jgi:hypothetical protein